MFKRLRDKFGGRKPMTEFDDHIADSYYLRKDDVIIANGIKTNIKTSSLAPPHSDASADTSTIVLTANTTPTHTTDDFNVRSHPTDAKNNSSNNHDKRYHKEIVYSTFQLRDYTNVDDPSMTKFAYEMAKVLDM